MGMADVPEVPVPEPEQRPEDVGDEVELALRQYARRNRRGWFVVSPRLIGSLLGLPETAEIIGLHTDPRSMGLIVNIVDDNLPEIGEDKVGTEIGVSGYLRLMPAPPIDPDGPDTMPEPGPDDVMYARLEFALPTPTKETTP